MSQPKSNYKVWIRSKQQYWSNNSKTTWTAISWVMYAADDAARCYGPSNIEIHEFPTSSAIVHSYSEMHLEEVKKSEEKKIKAQNRKNKIAENRKVLDAKRNYNLAKNAFDLAEKTYLATLQNK